MSEIVQERLDEMEPALAQLLEKGFVSEEELQKIRTIREKYEYKIARKKKVKIDFLRYILSELNFEYKIKKEDPQTRYIFQKNIHRLFQIALKHFYDDLELWLEYIRFARLSKSFHCLEEIFLRVIGQFPNIPDLYVLAASWEYDEKADIEAARRIFQRALRLLEKEPILWQEYFRLEGLFAEKVYKRKDALGIEQHVVDYSVAEVILKRAALLHPHMKSDFLGIAETFPENKQLLERIEKSF